MRIYHECEGRIEKSVPRIVVWHNEACRVMTNGDPEGWIFLLYPHTNNGFFFLHKENMGLFGKKPVFGVSDKARFKPVSSVTGTSYELEIWHVARLDMIFSKMRKTKSMIRLGGCAGWSAPLLYPNPEDRFSRDEPHMSCNIRKTTMWLCLMKTLRSA